MRLDKYLSHTLNFSRSEARQAIKKGLVLVNQEVIFKSDFQIDEQHDLVSFLEEELEYREFVYLMLNKPKDYLSSTKDDRRATVLDLIKGYENFDLVIAGRLDFDSEGLIILTNDGSFVHKLTSPNYKCPKTYQVVVEGVFEDEDIRKFQKGVKITDRYNQVYITKPASLKILSPSEALITIIEGKFHQVKKMCLSIGKEVRKLKRIKIGTLELDPTLKPGEFRELTDEEVASLKK